VIRSSRWRGNSNYRDFWSVHFIEAVTTRTLESSFSSCRIMEARLQERLRRYHCEDTSACCLFVGFFVPNNVSSSGPNTRICNHLHSAARNKSLCENSVISSGGFPLPFLARWSDRSNRGCPPEAVKFCCRPWHMVRPSTITLEITRPQQQTLSEL
jgi:hypothetical protein